MPTKHIHVVRRQRRRAAPKQLSPLAEQAKAHWKEHRPQMYAELEKAGTLDQAAQRASDQTKEEMSQANRGRNELRRGMGNAEGKIRVPSSRRRCAAAGREPEQLRLLLRCLVSLQTSPAEPRTRTANL